MASDFNAVKEEHYSLLREREDWVRKMERSQDPAWRVYCQSNIQKIDAKLARLKSIIDAEERRRAAERAEKEARDKKEAEEIAKKEAEFRRSHGRYPYKNYCYQCKKDVNEAIHPKCDKCGWIKCNKCGSCRCNMQFAV